MRAYKLACLNYKSSAIPLSDGNKYSRKQIASMQETLLKTLTEEVLEQKDHHDILKKTLSMEFDLRTSEFEPKIKTSPRFI